MREGFDFGKDYQRKVLKALIVDRDFLSKYSKLIKPFYFEDSIHQWLFAKIDEYYQKYKKNCSLDYLRENQSQKILAQTYEEELKEIDASSLAEEEYTEDLVLRFARNQAMKAAILNSVDLLGSGNYEKIDKQVSEALMVGKKFEDLGVFYFKDIEERFGREGSNWMAEKVPTLIERLDNFLEGGLPEKTLGVLLAPTKAGKSFFLVNIAKGALYCGRKVVFYSFELSQDSIARRFDMSFLNKTSKGVQETPKRAVERLREVEEICGGELVIKEFPTRQASISDIRSHLQLLAGKGFSPDLIIVDYAAIMSPEYRHSEDRHSLASCYYDLRGLALQMGIPIWTAAQARRETLSRAIIRMQDISESIEICNAADLILAICQTEEEKEKKIYRLFVAGHREGAMGMSLVVRGDPTRMMVKDFIVESPDR